MTFEQEYLKKVHRLFAWGFALHIPFCIGLGWFFNSLGFIEAFCLTLICAGPIASAFVWPTSRLTSFITAVASISMSGLIIHLSRGMIEMHFHIFTMIAILIVLGNPLVILAAAGTAAVHHLTFFFLLPKSVFNYQASLSIVLVHAGFVVFETIPAAMIARTFGSFIRAQATLGERLAVTAEDVRSSAKEMFDRQSQIATAVNDQTEKMSSAMSTIGRIDSVAKQTSTSARRAESIIHETAQSTKTGRNQIHATMKDVDSLRKSNASVREQVESSFGDLGRIIQMIGEIARKTEVINDIVFQTKLLSFNASVEAARAGEHGKGFAVVAEEVGKLASLSGQSAHEINALLEESQKSARTTLESNQQRVFSLLERNSGEIAAAAASVESCGRVFEEIHAYVNQSAELVTQIANANDDQKTGMTVVRDSIDKVQELSCENAQRIKESFETATSMKAQGDHLQTTLDQVMSELRVSRAGRADERAA